MASDAAPHAPQGRSAARLESELPATHQPFVSQPLPAPDQFNDHSMDELAKKEVSWRNSSLDSVADGDEAREALLRVRTELDDVESQKAPFESSTPRPLTGAEYAVPTSKKVAFLTLYFFFNLSLTIYNKAVLGRFAFPWILTAIHTASAAVGCYCLMLAGQFKLTKLSFRENMVLVAFSLLFTLNIAMSNVSLSMVSVPFHQIARSTSPVCTIMIYRVFYSRTYSQQTYLSLIPIIAGVGLATFGDYYFTALGFTLTFLGVVLASIKASIAHTVATNRLMTGNLKLPAMEVLLRMSPLAAVQSLFYAYATGEMEDFTNWAQEGNLTRYVIIAVAGNGLLAFVLNVASFQTNKIAGALTISVCANVKQCLTILLGVVLFNVNVSAMNGLGMAVALAGAAWYSKVEVAAKGQKTQPAAEAQPVALLASPAR